MEFLDDDLRAWRLERQEVGGEVLIEVYIDNQFSHEVALTYQQGSLESMRLLASDGSSWVEVGPTGEVVDSNFEFDYEDEGCDEAPGGSGPGDPPIGEPGEGDGCEDQNLLMNGFGPDPCQDELDEAVEAIYDGYQMFGYGVVMTAATGGAMAVPAQFGTGFFGLRAAIRAGALVYCRLTSGSNSLAQIESPTVLALGSSPGANAC
jgi:hypothetical protein